MTSLLDEPIPYLQHYISLHEKYISGKEIYREYLEDVKTKIIANARRGRYKFQMYLELNPLLSTSPYLSNLHPMCNNIIKFRVGSHNLPIEKGRWNRIPREERICAHCGILGDEKHIIYQCGLIQRNDLLLSKNLNEIWYQKDIFELFIRISSSEFL